MPPKDNSKNEVGSGIGFTNAITEADPLAKVSYIYPSGTFN